MAKATILIVEDEAIVAADLADRLARLGYAISGTTGYAEAAVTHTRELRPDLVLMDIRLAGLMDGVKAAEIMRSEFDLPVIYLTSHADRATLERAELTEPFSYLLKPFDDFRLETHIEMALYKHQTERKLRQTRDELELRVQERTQELKEAQKKLKRINETLEQRVAERTDELLKSEERYRSILHASPDDITITDMVGRILMVSPAGVSMFGYDQEEIGWGRLVTEFIAPEDRECASANVILKIQGVLSGPNQYRGLRRDGSTFDIEVNSDLIRGPDGQPTGIVYIVRDITERKRAEEENRSLHAQLNQAQKMEAIGTLAGGIAHDFNNILGAILGYTEMAKDTVPSGSMAGKNLDKVLEASHRAATLVKQILAYSRQTHIENVPLDLAPLVNEAIKLIRPSLPSTIAILQQIDTATRPILADPTQIHQILMNLCTNAFHAMEQTGGMLEITLNDCELSPSDLQPYPEVQPGNFLKLTISDTGTGIESEIGGRIFDPYFTTKGVGKGTGMGLAIVHGIVTSYGGFITRENNPGNGTVFRVFIPAIDQEIAPEVMPVEAVPLGSGRILWVDDEVVLAELGKSMLERWGYEVTVQSSSLEAFTVFQGDPDQFDAVITDQTMPGLTGMDLARQMLQIRPDLPIILCTGYSTLVNEEQAMAQGITEFVMKPLTKNLMATILKRALATAT